MLDLDLQDVLTQQYSYNERCRDGLFKVFGDWKNSISVDPEVFLFTPNKPVMSLGMSLLRQDSNFEPVSIYRTQ